MKSATTRWLIPTAAGALGVLSLAVVLLSGRGTQHAPGPASLRSAVEVWRERAGHDERIDSNANVRPGDRLSFVWRGQTARHVMVFAGSPTRGVPLFPASGASTMVAPGERMRAGADVATAEGPEVIYLISADAPFSAEQAARGAPGLEPMRLLFLRDKP